MFIREDQDLILEYDEEVTHLLTISTIFSP